MHDVFICWQYNSSTDRGVDPDHAFQRNINTADLGATDGDVEYEERVNPCFRF